MTVHTQLVAARPRIHARRERRGISLVGVLSTLCFVALVAVIAIPRFFARHDITLENACRLLTRDLRSVQNRAAWEKLGARLVFDADGWRAFDDSGQPLGGLGEEHPIARRFSADGVFEGVRVKTIECGPDSALSVDRRGLVLEAGRIVLEFRGDVRPVEIESGSGLVLVGDTDADAAGDAPRR